MLVLTVDQRGSRRDIDRVAPILDALSTYSLLRKFERTAGDEIQAVSDNAAQVVDVALTLIRDGHWSVGIGIGPVQEPLPPQTRAGRGPAFEAARLAVDRAKKAPARIALAHASTDTHHVELTADADAAFTLLGTVMNRQTSDGREAIALMDTGLTQVAAARHLSITKQAMSRRLAAAEWQTELAGRRLAHRLLVRAHP
ncbi:hypothetical protein ABH922_002053 [Rhodococcus sp. 27YEA15]|uniref:hypothetical protein n=1 Tax=Rhodococcus sp. 27YEA15 TaxID=3156259 RepID=UPI003C7A1184